MEHSRLDQKRKQELCQTRTELYELLLYAQKMYRETGQARYLQNVKAIRTRIYHCEKDLESLMPE